MLICSVCHTTVRTFCAAGLASEMICIIATWAGSSKIERFLYCLHSVLMHLSGRLIRGGGGATTVKDLVEGSNNLSIKDHDLLLCFTYCVLLCSPGHPSILVVTGFLRTCIAIPIHPPLWTCMHALSMHARVEMSGLITNFLLRQDKLFIYGFFINNSPMKIIKLIVK